MQIHFQDRGEQAKRFTDAQISAGIDSGAFQGEDLDRSAGKAQGTPGI
jgi:hypothetical protein